MGLHWFAKVSLRRIYLTVCLLKNPLWASELVGAKIPCSRVRWLLSSHLSASVELVANVSGPSVGVVHVMIMINLCRFEVGLHLRS